MTSVLVAAPAAYAADTAGELERINAAAAAHRDLAGIRPGVQVTDAQCRHLRALREHELESAGVTPGAREWFTGQRVDGRICVIWGQSAFEAALSIAQFVGPLAWLVPDGSLEVRGQYVAGRDAGSSFPVSDRPLTRAELAMRDTPADALF
jgi:hypothetical protein